MVKYRHVNREQGGISFENQIMPGTFEHSIDFTYGKQNRYKEHWRNI
jgi:hypothetical protein